MFVRLKWGLEYRGFLVSTDGYMNLQVSDSYRPFLLRFSKCEAGKYGRVSRWSIKRGPGRGVHQVRLGFALELSGIR